MTKGPASMSFSGGMKRELKRFARTSPAMFKESMRFASILFITYMVEGRYGPKPPIADGFLRGSFSTFVDNRYVANKLLAPPPSGKGQVRVRTSDIDTTGTKALWVSNMPYASRMENDTWTPGPRSGEDGNVGNKFMATALKNGAEDWGRNIAERMKRSMNAQGNDVPKGDII